MKEKLVQGGYWLRNQHTSGASAEQNGKEKIKKCKVPAGGGCQYGTLELGGCGEGSVRKDMDTKAEDAIECSISDVKPSVMTAMVGCESLDIRYHCA